LTSPILLNFTQYESNALYKIKKLFLYKLKKLTILALRQKYAPAVAIAQQLADGMQTKCPVGIY